MRLRVYRIVSAVLAVALFIGPATAAAQTVEEAKSQLNAASGQVNQLQGQVAQKQAESNTLKSQLALIDGQVAILSGQIHDNQDKVTVLNIEIAKVDAELAAKKKLLNAYVRTQYTNGKPSTFELVVSSGDLSSFLDRKEYMDRGQEKANKLVADVVAAKKELDTKKRELDAVRDQLAQQQLGLDVQRNAKNELLVRTQGEEANYAVLLSEAQAAASRMRQTIYNLMGSGGMVSKGHVSAGQVIGYEGSTGNSTGPHLHFSVYVNRVAQDPNAFINSGKIFEPMANYYVSQGFGCTPYPFELKDAKCSSGHSHDGIDFAAPGGTPIRAAADGEIIMNSFQDGGFGHYIVIDHGGFWTLYGHMQ